MKCTVAMGAYKALAYVLKQVSHVILNQELPLNNGSPDQPTVGDRKCD